MAETETEKHDEVKTSSDVNSESSELKNELTEFQEELKETSTSQKEEKEELSVEVMDLKRRIATMEKDVKGLSEALKNTLTDIRSLIAELDNPFNLLRSVGVDDLVQRIMEQMEDEVSKARREEMKKKIAKGEEEEQKEKIVVTPTPQSIQPIIVPSNLSSSNNQKTTSGEINQTNVDNVKSSPNTIKENNFSQKSEKNLALEVKENPKTFYQINNNYRNLPTIKTTSFLTQSSKELPLTYRTAYLMLVAEYLLLRVGERKADLLLTDYAKKGWISPTIIRDLLDILNLLKPYNSKFNSQDENSLEGEVDIEDHLLIINFLKKIEDFSVKEEDPINILFMLFLSKAISHLLKVFHLSKKKMNYSLI